MVKTAKLEITWIFQVEAAFAVCANATEATGVPWQYLLVRHDAFYESKTFAGLDGTYEYQPAKRKDDA